MGLEAPSSTGDDRKVEDSEMDAEDSSQIMSSPCKAAPTGRDGLMKTSAGGGAGFELDDEEDETIREFIRPLRLGADVLEAQLESRKVVGRVARATCKKRLSDFERRRQLVLSIDISSLDLNIDEKFIAICLTIKQDGYCLPSPLPLEGMATDHVRLTEKYPCAYSDFYPSRTPCIFKSGPDWPASKGPMEMRIEREARPIYGHPIGSTWRTIGESIYQRLDIMGIKWTSINPLAYADAEEAKPFCPLIVSIGVKPHSLIYEDAVTAATAVKTILAEAGFPDIEVAFVESVVTRSVAAGPKLLSFDPLLNEVPVLRKPFTAALGLSIAPLKYPYFEGTAALYFRLSKDDDRTAILTCAHVARPLPVYSNTSLTLKNASQRREEVVALGSMGYSNAIRDIMTTISDLVISMNAWKKVLDRLGDPVQGEPAMVTERRQEHVNLLMGAKREIERANALYDKVTKQRSTADLRIIGFVLHSEKIELSVNPHGFTKDWALIELYNEKIDWTSFKGNKVYVGGNLSIADFGNTMFPQVTDQADYEYPEDGLLQAYGVVSDDEIRNPQHLDVHNEKCLIVIKNGSTTGTTVGRVSGLESFTRSYEEYGMKEASIEIAVLPYDRKHGKFSDSGDSGSIVLSRDGRIVGILTGGAGSTDETDITYLTPYWWVEKEIKAKYPGCFLYQVVE